MAKKDDKLGKEKPNSAVESGNTKATGPSPSKKKLILIFAVMLVVVIGGLASLFISRGNIFERGLKLDTFSSEDKGFELLIPVEWEKQDDSLGSPTSITVTQPEDQAKANNIQQPAMISAGTFPTSMVAEVSSADEFIKSIEEQIKQDLESNPDGKLLSSERKKINGNEAYVIHGETKNSETGNITHVQVAYIYLNEENSAVVILQYEPSDKKVANSAKKILNSFKGL